MARNKKSQTEQLTDLLRARGLRKQVAQQIATAVGRAPKRKPPKAVRSMIGDLGSVVRDLEQRVTGSGGKDAKRVAAGKKAATTRKRDAAKRSASAKKGAATRAKASSTTRSRTTSTRAKPKARAKAKR